MEDIEGFADNDLWIPEDTVEEPQKFGCGGKGFKIGGMKSLEWVSRWEMKGVWDFLR